jgi:hypothetical protein
MVEARNDDDCSVYGGMIHPRWKFKKFNCIIELCQDGQAVENVGPCSLVSSAGANEKSLNQTSKASTLTGRDPFCGESFTLC